MVAVQQIAVIGLGYVGLPVAVAFGGKGYRVIGFDIDAGRLDELRRGHDRTGEVSREALAGAGLELTDQPEALSGADIHIVTVPTPISEARRPDFGPLFSASRTVGRRLKRGAI